MRFSRANILSAFLWIISLLFLFQTVTQKLSATDIQHIADTSSIKKELVPVKKIEQTSKKDAKKTSTELINVNTATAKELCKLKGIGPKTAEKIIIFRTKNGPFKKGSDLQNVKGIGPKKLGLIINNIDF